MGPFSFTPNAAAQPTPKAVGCSGLLGMALLIYWAWRTTHQYGETNRASNPTDCMAASSKVLAGCRLSHTYANTRTTGIPSARVQRSSVVWGRRTPTMAKTDSRRIPAATVNATSVIVRLRTKALMQFAMPNVELTGAAQPYRAASSDRRERGRAPC